MGLGEDITYTKDKKGNWTGKPSNEVQVYNIQDTLPGELVWSAESHDDAIGKSTNSGSPDGTTGISDFVTFNSKMMESVSSQLNSATDLTTSTTNRAVLAALLSLEFADQRPDFKLDYTLPIYVSKLGRVASVAIGGEKGYALILYQMNPLKTGYGILDSTDSSVIRNTLEASNEAVWQVSLDDYNKNLAALVEQLG